MAASRDNNDWGTPIRYITLVTRQQQIDSLAEVLDDYASNEPYWKLFGKEIGERPPIISKIERMTNNTTKSGGREILNNWQHTQQATVQNYIRILQKINCESGLQLFARWILDAPDKVVSHGHPLRTCFFLNYGPEGAEPEPIQRIERKPTAKFDACLIDVGGIPEMDSAALPDYLFWPRTKKVLNIQFMEQGEEFAEFRNKVKEVAPAWSAYCGIKFDFDGQEQSDIRISFKGDASQSAIGKLANSIPKDKPTMHLVGLEKLDDKEKKRTILHEFGHALGLIHEHQRPDIKIPWDFKKTFHYFQKYFGWNHETIINNVIQPKYDANYIIRFKTEFDRNSIMLYPFPSDLLEPRDPNYAKWSALINDQDCNDLSEADKQIFKDFYRLT